MILTGYLRVLAAILSSICWMVVSSTLILGNKHLLVDLHFEYPLAISAMGMVVSSVLSLICIRAKLVEPQVHMTREFWIKRILPIGLLHSLSLSSGTYVYMYLSVAFVQMLKAFTPIIIMLCLFAAKMEKPTKRVILSVLLIAVGTACTAYGELNLSVFGVLCMNFSQLCESIRLVLTQTLLVGLQFHPIEGLSYTAPACTLWLVTGSLFLEVPHMLANNTLSIVAEHKYFFLGCSVVGFAVNALSYLTIKLASSLTLKILATVKNTLLVIVGVFFLGEYVTGFQFAGYSLSLAGFVWYNFYKLNEIAQEGHRATAPAADESLQGAAEKGSLAPFGSERHPAPNRQPHAVDP